MYSPEHRTAVLRQEPGSCLNGLSSPLLHTKPVLPDWDWRETVLFSRLQSSSRAIPGSYCRAYHSNTSVPSWDNGGWVNPDRGVTNIAV